MQFISTLTTKGIRQAQGQVHRDIAVESGQVQAMVWNPKSVEGYHWNARYGYSERLATNGVPGPAAYKAALIPNEL